MMNLYIMVFLFGVIIGAVATSTGSPSAANALVETSTELLRAELKKNIIEGTARIGVA